MQKYKSAMNQKQSWVKQKKARLKILSLFWFQGRPIITDDPKFKNENYE